MSEGGTVITTNLIRRRGKERETNHVRALFCYARFVPGHRQPDFDSAIDEPFMSSFARRVLLMSSSDVELPVYLSSFCTR